MIFQKSPPVETAQECPCSASTGPLKICMHHPRTKAHAHEIHENAGSISNTYELLWPVRGDMKKKLPTTPVWLRTAIVCSVELAGCASS
jgi:hypothetical protein